MRSLPEGMAAALDAGAARLCHVWIVTRRDDGVLGLTDHDRDLVFQGVVCRADTGMTAGAARQAVGEAGDGALAGVIASEVVTAEDIAAGLYDAAVIVGYVVDWSDVTQFVEVSRGTFGRIEQRGEGFVAHVEGMLSRLDRVIGRRFTHLCDAVLGDGRCRVAVEPGQVCDKRYATCVGTFGNGVNFRGFPDLPGEDFLTAYPRVGDVMDGRSRGQGGGR